MVSRRGSRGGGKGALPPPPPQKIAPPNSQARIQGGQEGLAPPLTKSWIRLCGGCMKSCKKSHEHGAYYHLVKDLQLHEEQFQRYFSLTREDFKQVLYLRSGSTREPGTVPGTVVEPGSTREPRPFVVRVRGESLLARCNTHTLTRTLIRNGQMDVSQYSTRSDWPRTRTTNGWHSLVFPGISWSVDVLVTDTLILMRTKARRTRSRCRCRRPKTLPSIKTLHSVLKLARKHSSMFLE